MPHLREIAPGILVATGELFVTNSTAVAGPGGCLLIDPAVTPAELRLIAAGLTARGLPPAGRLRDARALGSRAVVPGARRRHPGSPPRRPRWPPNGTAASMISAVQDAAPGHDLELFGRLRPLGPGQEEIAWDGPQARVLAHDGHAPGHGAVFLPGAGVLVAGDMCSDIEVPLLDLTAADPVGDYRAGLELLAGVTGVQWVIPGHGGVGDAAAFRARVTADLAYLSAVERGQDPGDARLRPGWLRDEHERQLQYLRGRG